MPSDVDNMFGDYASIQSTRNNQATQDFERYFGAGRGGQSDIVTLQSGVDSMFPGTTRDQLASLEQSFADLQQVYKDQTNQMAIVNDLANTSSYVTSTVDKEYDRLSSLKEKTYSSVHKMRQSYMLKKYDIAYNQFVSGIVQFTLFTTVVCTLIYTYKLTGGISDMVAYGVIGLIAVLYLIIVLVFVKQSLIRRKDDWNKFYFGSMK